jgi:hypothetical protein
MPEDDKKKKDEVAGVDLDQYQKEKDEFSEAFDEVMNADDKTSDEEINEALDGKKKDKEDDETGEAGEATKDQDDDPHVMSEEDANLFTSDNGVAQTDNNTDSGNEDGSDETDWKAKFEEVDALLKKERQKTSSWDGRIRAANQKARDLQAEVDRLVAEKEANAIDPDKETDNEILERFGKDFPELADVVNVLKKRVDGVTKQTAQSSSSEGRDSEGSSGDSTATYEDEGSSTHQADVNRVHPDLSEMVNSGVLLTWINKQKPFIKPTLENIYYNGSTQAVIDMCTQFKKSTGWKSQLANSETDTEAERLKKLESMKEVNSESGGAPTDGPDKHNFEQGAKDAGL